MGRLGLPPAETPNPERVAAHMARPLGGKVLVTTPSGHWTVLEESDYRRYLKGGVSNEEALGAELRKKGLFRDYQDFAGQGRSVASREGLAAKGPSAHAVYLKETGLRLAAKTAMRVVDFIFECPSPDIAISLHGGPDPVLVKLITRYAELKNGLHKRRLSVMDCDVLLELDDAKLEEILAARVVDPEQPRPAGTGVLGGFVYGPDGSVYAGSGGELPQGSDADLFRIATAGECSYAEALEHPALRAFLLAESPLAQPMCSQCVYAPYCPVLPGLNFRTQGSPFGHMPTNGRCVRLMGLFDRVFARLQCTSSATLAIFTT